MEQTPAPRRRLNIVSKAARRKRIFDKLREGWAYDEIAREERVSAERIRQIVSEVLGKRVIDRGADDAASQALEPPDAFARRSSARRSGGGSQGCPRSSR